MTERGLVAWVHGGPTGQTRVTWLPRIAWLVTRGWAVLVPDHRGTTGWGRSFREALDGEWGVADVDDVLAAADAAVARGWAAPGRVVVMGGSAGGFTVLHALAAGGSRVAAGIALFPVTDLHELDATTHRFERHYTKILVGPVERYDERSPLSRVADITAPLLLLHGDADVVVSVNQSRCWRSASLRSAVPSSSRSTRARATDGAARRRPSTS